MSEASKQAWGDFWAGQSGRGGGGCLPEGYRGIETAQKAAWHSLAEEFHEGAKVLDLATGDGRVMEWLLEKAPQIEPVGVDLAPELPSPPAGTSVRPGIAMESLPFDSDSFDAVVSQFGYEYGDVPKVSAEVARVLQPGGILAILTHRIDGPILAHNTARRMQIGWIFDRKDLFHRAKAALAAGAAAPPFEFSQIVQEGAQRFGPQSAAWEIGEAVRRAMVLRAQSSVVEVRGILDAIARQARNEIGRIDSLESACRTTQDSDGFDAQIVEAGFEICEISSLSEAESARPFADFRRYRRRA